MINDGSSQSLGELTLEDLIGTVTLPNNILDKIIPIWDSLVCNFIISSSGGVIPASVRKTPTGLTFNFNTHTTTYEVLGGYGGRIELIL